MREIAGVARAGTWALLALLLSGCTGEKAATDAGLSAVDGDRTGRSEADIELPDGPWRDLARRLVDAGSLEESVDITREVLARGGVATHDGERVLVAARGPAATFVASPRETVHLAMEARRRPGAGRLTIAELAQMLEGFGFPFPAADANAAAQDAVDRSTRGADAADSTGAADDAARESQRTASSAQDEAARAGLQDITHRWQLARQAVNRTPASGRAAAQAEVERLWTERKALIAQRGEAQRKAHQDSTALRDRLVAQREQARRTQMAQRRIGADPVQGERLMALLDTWVREAAKHPDDPRSFTPLFLAEMARLQDAPVDLAGSAWTRPGRGRGAPVDLRGAARSQQLRWTLLELELFGAAFDRGRPRVSVGAGLLHNVALAATDALVPRARAGNACIDYKDAYGDTWGEVVGAAGGWGVGQALDRGIGAAIDSGAAEAFGKAMNAIGIATKLAKLASFYGDNQVDVEPEPRSLHKPTGSVEYAMYVARVGFNEEAVREYERQVREVSAADRMARDCLNALGFPTFSDLADMTRDAESWLIEWKLTDGKGNHAREAPWTMNQWAFPGRRAMGMKRESATSLRADYIIEVLPEPAHSGKTVRAYAVAEARVDAAGMPSLGTFVTGAAGGLGLAEALVELFGGWFQFVNMPKAYGTIEIEYHCARPGTLYRTDKPAADGAGDPGPDSCLIAAEAE